MGPYTIYRNLRVMLVILLVNTARTSHNIPLVISAYLTGAAVFVYAIIDLQLIFDKKKDVFTFKDLAVSLGLQILSFLFLFGLTWWIFKDKHELLAQYFKNCN